MPETKKDIINQILFTKGDDLNLTHLDLGKLSKIALKSLQTFIYKHTLDHKISNPSVDRLGNTIDVVYWDQNLKRTKKQNMKGIDSDKATTCAMCDRLAATKDLGASTPAPGHVVTKFTDGWCGDCLRLEKKSNPSVDRLGNTIDVVYWDQNLKRTEKQNMKGIDSDKVTTCAMCDRFAATKKFGGSTPDPGHVVTKFTNGWCGDCLRLEKSKPRIILKNELIASLSRQFHNQKSVHASITIFNDREDEFGGEDSGITLWSLHSKGKMTYHITDEYKLDGANNVVGSCVELEESMLEDNHHVFNSLDGVLQKLFNVLNDADITEYGKFYIFTSIRYGAYERWGGYMNNVRLTNPFNHSEFITQADLNMWGLFKSELSSYVLKKD